ncbi:hypothetical protein [Streptomyces sp. NRRL S-87]|uniref:hypothetical protein n=1 Tax=Streptomyces sp. NRRL S-87 TaxID=1463920 RepID=UPI000D144D0E|nr:hypothetical protein [Streptomyces sp. NRRL S-87]
MGVERAEAAIVEHYPRLVRMAYLVLPPSLGRHRRVLTAHALAQGALPRSSRATARSRATGSGTGTGTGTGTGSVSRSGTGTVPTPRAGLDRVGGDAGYAYVRLRVLRAALEAGLPLRRLALPKRAQLPPLLPQVRGLRVFPRAGGADELALDQWLASLTGEGRAAFVLRAMERLPEPEVLRLLAEAGVADPAEALAQVGEAESDALLDSPEFDPCVLQARPTDLMRRRRHARAWLAAAAAAAVAGTLLALPGGGWGADGAAAPPYARNAAAEQALDPARVTVAGATDWRASTRTDFSAWPARGDRTGDHGLLRRALAVWARPGSSVQASATPGTPSGPPMGPPQLLFAGEVDQAVVVLLYDGLRIARYAEPREGTAGAALDFARADGASAATASAVVLSRVDGNVRYLTAPWVRAAAVRDLLRPDAAAVPLRLADGVTAPVASPALDRSCASWNALSLTGAPDSAEPSGTSTGASAGASKGASAGAEATRLVTDLGELIPARLTAGSPGAPHDVAGGADRDRWAKTACLLPAVRSHGVRSVNSWTYAHQPLPERGGTAAWVCTRAETWGGGRERVLAQFQTPGPGTGALVARAEGVPECGARAPRVLAGVLWKSGAGHWYVLAAGSGQFTSVTVGGAVHGTSAGNRLAVPARAGAQVELSGRLADGSRAGVLR